MRHCSQRFRSPTPTGPERRIDLTSESLVGYVFPNVQKSNAISLLNVVCYLISERPLGDKSFLSLIDLFNLILIKSSSFHYAIPRPVTGLSRYFH
jgi:hypothetical protein